jgi:CHASE3 domain sensor protein
LERLRPLIKEKLDELGNTIDVRRSQGPDAALAIVRTDLGKTAMDQIRAIGAEINSANEQLTRFSEDAHRSANRLGLISSLGSAALLFLLFVATVTIQKGTLRRERLVPQRE